jgi:putative ABC transport system substrate-binding protein
MSGDLGAKRLGLLHEMLPRAARLAMLVNSGAAIVQSEISDVQAAASAIGGQVEVFPVSNASDIDMAFLSLAQKRTDALLVSPDALLMNRRVQLATLAARHAIPAIYAFREYAEVGGLMSYGASLTDQARQTGIYTGRILKGEKPADLPVMRATKFEVVINLQTAKALGLDIPPSLLARADEVIE